MCIVERVASVVREIYALFLGGYSLNKIARTLTEKGYRTPSSYRDKNRASAWNEPMIKRILTLYTYTGGLCQGRTTKLSYKLCKRINRPPESFYCVSGTHEAIIPIKDFERVQELLGLRDYTPKGKLTANVLSGLVWCGGCGARMTFQTTSGRRYLVCSNWRKSGECTSNLVREDVLLTMISKAVSEFSAGIDTEELVNTYLLEKKPCSHEDKREAARGALALLYSDRAAGLVGEEDYNAMKKRLQSQLEDTAPLPESTVTAEEITAQISSFLQFEPLTREIAVSLISRIVVSTDGEISVMLGMSKNR